MSQLVVYARDRLTGDFYKDARDFKRGDVVSVFPSGTFHSSRMLTMPAFRIVEIPSLSYERAQTFLGCQILEVGDIASEETLAARAVRINVDDVRLPVGFAEWFADDRRTPPIYLLDIGLELIESLKVVKPKAADPALTGEQS